MSARECCMKTCSTSLDNLKDVIKAELADSLLASRRAESAARTSACSPSRAASNHQIDGYCMCWKMLTTTAGLACVLSAVCLRVLASLYKASSTESPAVGSMCSAPRAAAAAEILDDQQCSGFNTQKIYRQCCTQQPRL